MHESREVQRALFRSRLPPSDDKHYRLLAFFPTIYFIPQVVLAGWSETSLGVRHFIPDLTF